MTNGRINVDPKVKKRLIQEAGNKCANPGCPVRRTHTHHIRKWAVYQTNDEQEMIAVCPSCHDAIHFGQIVITDETLYEWKKISRKSNEINSHLYVEPNLQTYLLLGNLTFSNTEGMFMFNLSPHQYLKFRIISGNKIVLSLKLSSLDGTNVLEINENYLHLHDNSILEYREVPGHIIISTKKISSFIPEWVISQMRIIEPFYAYNDNFPLLEIEVIKPGSVRVLGSWVNNDTAVVITRLGLSFLRDYLIRPITFMGEHDGQEIRCGEITNNTLFGFF